MTEETGGRMIVANSEKHLAEAFDQISEELRSQYTLGYYPAIRRTMENSGRSRSTCPITT